MLYYVVVRSWFSGNGFSYSGVIILREKKVRTFYSPPPSEMMFVIGDCDLAIIEVMKTDPYFATLEEAKREYIRETFTTLKA